MTTDDPKPTRLHRALGDMSGETDPVAAFRERNSRTPYHPDPRPARDPRQTWLVVMATVAAVAMVVAAVGVWQIKARADAEARIAEDARFSECFREFGYTSPFDAPSNVITLCLDRP